MNEWTTTAHQAHWLHASARHHSVRKPFITTQILWGRGVANYADFCFKVFQDRVNNWSTAYLQRAEVRCCSGYDNGIHAPGGDSRTELDIVLILSHAVGVHRYPKKYQGRLEFFWILYGTNLSAAALQIKLQHIGQRISPWMVPSAHYPWSLPRLDGLFLKKGCKKSVVTSYTSIKLVCLLLKMQ